MGKTIAQKIFDAHMVEQPFPGTNVLKLDRVFCHEITTPIAINDLIERNKDRVFDSTKIKAVIDHVTPAKDSVNGLSVMILRIFLIAVQTVSVMQFFQKKVLYVQALL